MSGTPAKRKPASPDKGEAALAETQDQPRTVEWRGLTLTLPAKLPGSLYFDIAALEESDSPGVVLGVLKSLVGAEQVAVVRGRIAQDEVAFEDMEEVMFGLFNDLMGAYGMSAGESAASPES